MNHDPMNHDQDMPPELSEFLAQIVPPGGAFGHRQHIHLAWLTLWRHGTAEPSGRIGRWIRHIAVYERAPRKYNATITRVAPDLAPFPWQK
jgi:hypothetical protein